MREQTRDELLKEVEWLTSERDMLRQQCDYLIGKLMLANDEKDRFDRDLAHFSKGYTEAVTDVTGTIRK